MPLRLYASCPPGWWPFWLVKLGGGCRPRRAASVILDNGAYTFYLEGRLPSPEKWAARIARRAAQLRGSAEELYVVLPDYPLDPKRTMEAAKLSRWLCNTYSCIVVMHWRPDMSGEEMLQLFEEYMSTIEADLYAVPLKLNSTVRRSAVARKAIVDVRLQVKAAGLADRAAARHGARLHLLAPSTQLLRRTAYLRTVVSADTTNWTRAPTSAVKRLSGTISARNTLEREFFFTEYLDTLCKSVELEGWACSDGGVPRG